MCVCMSVYTYIYICFAYALTFYLASILTYFQAFILALFFRSSDLEGPVGEEELHLC